MSTTKVEFEAASGKKTHGEMALPAGEGQAGTVVLFHEWWGLNDHVRSILGRLAEAGFVALAVDLYDGKTTKDPGEAGKLMGQLDWGLAMDRAKGAFRYLSTHPRSNGKVAVMGFCMGGALSFAAASAIPELSAVVPFYGIPDASKLDLDAMRAPILAHFASRDGWAKPSAAEALREQLEARGKRMRLEVYEADHAFVNDTRPEVYAKEAAELAWRRTTEFLAEHVGR
jgi:carboxymethylenebutenolidase